MSIAVRRSGRVYRVECDCDVLTGVQSVAGEGAGSLECRAQRTVLVVLQRDGRGVGESDVVHRASRDLSESVYGQVVCAGIEGGVVVTVAFEVRGAIRGAVPLAAAHRVGFVVVRENPRDSEDYDDRNDEELLVQVRRNSDNFCLKS